MERGKLVPGQTLTRDQYNAMTQEEHRAHFGRMSQDERAALKTQRDTVAERIKTLGDERAALQSQIDEQSRLIIMAAESGEVDAVMRHQARRNALPLVRNATDARIVELQMKKKEIIEQLQRDNEPIRPGFDFGPSVMATGFGS